MPNDTSYRRCFTVLWSGHEQIRQRLDQIALHLAELAAREEQSADGDMPGGNEAASTVPDELRALQQDLSNEAQLSPRAEHVPIQDDCAAQWASLQRQRRTLTEQLATLLQLVNESGERHCTWHDLLSHYSFFATPLRAYLLQRCDLLRRTVRHSQDATHTPADTRGKCSGNETTPSSLIEVKV